MFLVGNGKRKLANGDERTPKKWKVTMVDIKSELNANWVIGDTAGHGNIETATLQGTLDVEPLI